MRVQSIKWLPYKRIILLCVFLIRYVSYSQIVNGIDYSKRSHAYKTFDIAGDDIFGQRFPSENYTYTDKETGVVVNALTTSRHNNSKMYQTHPQWTADGKYIIFSSNRTSKKNDFDRQYYAISTENFEIVQITTGKQGRDFHLGRYRNVAYQFKDNHLIEINIEQLLKHSEINQVKVPEYYEKLLVKVSDTIRPSGLALDAKENAAYFSSKVKESLYAIYKIDFKNGTTMKLLEVPFKVGHLQANPYITGEIMYCWETGGDSPQRIWYLSIDKNGKITNRPLYNERDNDWVTHEVFWGSDSILFHLMGHLDRLQVNQTGIYSLNLRTDELIFHGQIGNGGYWHCNASPDGKWIAGDTFDGKLYRINADNPEDITLLTQGHRLLGVGPFSKEAHMHQSISPDGQWVLFNSSLLTDNDIMLVPLQPEKH